MSGFSFSTRAVHAGQDARTTTGDVVPPIHLSTVFVTERVGELTGGYEYARGGNPTRDSLQEAIASLEGGGSAFVFPSGMSAEDTLLRAITRGGDVIGYGTDMYGGTLRLITQVLAVEGRRHVAVDMLDLANVEELLVTENVAVLWVETPSNPLLDVYDLVSLSEATRRAGTLLVVDSTLASPFLQRPLELGADVVVHSTTKYIGGHSDVIGGALVVAEGLELGHNVQSLSGSRLVADEVAFFQATVGAVPGPFDSYLAGRGLKSLEVRVRRQSETAQQVAEFLDAHPLVERVFYPGLPGHPGHEIADRQMDGYGGVLSFLAASPEEAIRICEATNLFTLGVSLGSVESLIEYPAVQTHAAKDDTPWPIDRSLVRLSVGLEHPEDLIDDLRQALG